jgi:SRSO17 transposase
VLVVDYTVLPKQGRHSVGVARQYCGASGKRANCQVLVSLTLARGEVPMPVGLRLFLPEAWAAARTGPGGEVWLVAERRGSGEKKYHLANLPADAALEELASLIKARWVCEHAHRQLKSA